MATQPFVQLPVLALLPLFGWLMFCGSAAAQGLDTEVKTLDKSNLKAINGAIVQVVASPSGPKVFEDKTGVSGAVKCPGLAQGSKYFFLASKTGFRREYVESEPTKNIQLELTRKYGK